VALLEGQVAVVTGADGESATLECKYREGGRTLTDLEIPATGTGGEVKIRSEATVIFA
jgi:hypothetical protein